MEDLYVLVNAHLRKNTDCCPDCGGTKRRRVHITGTDELDYIKCKTCNGRGEKQKLRKTTAYNELTQHWRNEF